MAASTSTGNAVATFSSVFAITMDPNASAVLTSGLNAVANNVAQLDAKLQSSRVSSSEAAAVAIRKSLKTEQQSADESFLAQMARIRELHDAKAAWALTDAEATAARQRALADYEKASPSHKKGRDDLAEKERLIELQKQEAAEEAIFRQQQASNIRREIMTKKEAATEIYRHRMSLIELLFQKELLTDDEVMKARRGAKDKWLRDSGKQALMDDRDALVRSFSTKEELSERWYKNELKRIETLRTENLLTPVALQRALDHAEKERDRMSGKTARIDHTKDIIATVREQQAQAQKDRLAEGEHLRWSMMTEKEKFAVRQRADMAHLNMLLQMKAITDADFAKLSTRAGTLGLGSTPFDNNMRNTGFRGAMIAQQVGFGVQDFMSQMTNAKTVSEGMGRGMMALSNNVQMMGASFGQTGLAVTAIGGTLVGLVVPAMVKWLSAAREVGAIFKDIEGGMLGQIDMLSRVAAGRITEAVPGEAAFDAMTETMKKEVTMREEARIALEKVQAAEMAHQQAQWDDQERVRKAFQNEKFVPALMTTMQSGLNKIFGGTGVLQSEAGANAEAILASAREKLKKSEFALQQARRDRSELDKKFGDDIRQFESQKDAESMMADVARKPLGQSAMSVIGTAAAASAINRALAGGRTVEQQEQKKQTKELEKANKLLEKISTATKLRQAVMAH